MPANLASSSQALGPKSALLLATWLTVQLVGFVFMVILAGFHYGQTRSTLCLTTLNSSNSDAVNASSSAGPSCESDLVILSFAVIACIITVIDATINMDYLIHRVKGEELPSGCCCRCRNCCFDYLPMGIVRVCYCWTLIHIILITTAGNTYEWSWQTDDLDVLTSTTMFFFASITYLVLFVAICIWQYTIFKTFVTIKLGINYCTDQSNGAKTMQKLSLCMHWVTSALFLSHVILTIAFLVAFFDRSDVDGPSLSPAIEIFVIVYVCLSLLFWFSAIVYIVNILEMHDASKHCRTTGTILIVIFFVIILFVSIFLYIGVRAILLNSIAQIIFLCLLGFSFIFGLISTCVCFNFSFWLCRLPLYPAPV